MITGRGMATRKREGEKARERNVRYLLAQLQIGVELESEECVSTFSWLLLWAIIDMSID